MKHNLYSPVNSPLNIKRSISGTNGNKWRDGEEDDIFEVRI